MLAITTGIRLNSRKKSSRTGLGNSVADMIREVIAEVAICLHRKRSRTLLDRARSKGNNLGPRRIVERHSVAMLGALFRIQFPLTAGGMIAPPQPHLAPRAPDVQQLKLDKLR